MKTAYIGGTFDIPHFGHFELFRKVKEMGYRTVVVMNSDKFVQEYRNEPPIMNEHERAAQLSHCRFIDELRTVDRDGQKAMIESVKPDVIVVGTDWMKPEILPQLGIDEDFLRDKGIAMVFLPYTREISTSEIKRRIRGE